MGSVLSPEILRIRQFIFTLECSVFSKKDPMQTFDYYFPGSIFWHYWILLKVVFLGVLWPFAAIGIAAVYSRYRPQATPVSGKTRFPLYDCCYALTIAALLRFIALAIWTGFRLNWEFMPSSADTVRFIYDSTTPFMMAKISIIQPVAFLLIIRSRWSLTWADLGLQMPGPGSKALIWIVPVSLIAVAGIDIMIFDYPLLGRPQSSLLIERLSWLEPGWRIFFWCTPILITPALEEMISRVVLFNCLKAYMGPVAAIVLQALAFAMGHPTSKLLPALALGLVAGYIYHRYKSVYPCYGIHVALNLMVNGLPF